MRLIPRILSALAPIVACIAIACAESPDSKLAAIEVCVDTAYEVSNHNYGRASCRPDQEGTVNCSSAMNGGSCVLLCRCRHPELP